jgi:hypothetical protein
VPFRAAPARAHITVAPQRARCISKTRASVAEIPQLSPVIVRQPPLIVHAGPRLRHRTVLAAAL